MTTRKIVSILAFAGFMVLFVLLIGFIFGRIYTKATVVKAKSKEHKTEKNVTMQRSPHQPMSLVGYLQLQNNSNLVSIFPEKIQNLKDKGFNVDPLILKNEKVSGQGVEYFERNAQGILAGDSPDIIHQSAVKEEMSFLQLKKGETVIDVGTGSSNYLLTLSEIVGPTGKIITTDINSNSKTYGEWKMKTILDSGLYRNKIINFPGIGKNIVFRTNTESDLGLTDPIADSLILIQVHLYNRLYDKDGKEFDNAEFTASMVKAVKPGGRIIILDYYSEKHGNMPTKDAIKKIERIYKKFNCEVVRTAVLRPKSGDWDEIYGLEIKKK